MAFCQRYGLRIPILQAPMVGSCPVSITLLSIFLLIAWGFRKLAGHGVECQAMAAEY